MPQYFFHSESDVRHIDNEGVELANLESACAEAVRLAGEILRDKAGKFWGSKPWTLTVTDEVGLVFFTLELHGQDAPVAVGSKLDVF